MTHVLIATDGSEQSLKAARYLRSLLDPASLARVSVIAVVRPLAAVPFASDFGEEKHAAQEAEALRRQAEAQYEELRAAQEAQRQLAREVDERINQATAEAAALAERDQELSDQIAEEAAQFAQYIQGMNLGPVGPVTNAGPVSVADAGNGIVVNVSIVDQIHPMIVAAANDGVTLSGGGYRDPQQQIALRQAHCGSSYYAIYQAPSSSCSPPTAIPGTSMHEQGLAIDFDNCSYGTSVYNWLSGNAANYGLHNLPSESWHWSTTGS